MNDTTSGSDSREPRALDDELLAFELDREIALLRAEAGYREFGRSSKTLGKGANVRLVVTAARAGVTIGDDDAEAPIAVQVIDGAVRLGRAGDGIPFRAGTVAWFGEGGGWSVTADEDSALLLSIGWPGADTGEEQSHDR